MNDKYMDDYRMPYCARFNEKTKRLEISMSVNEAQILMYALNRFAEQYGKMDRKAQGWADQMKLLSDRVMEAL